MRLTANHLTETLQARREWRDILKMIKKKKTYNQNYPVIISFRFNGKIKTLLISKSKEYSELPKQLCHKC